jgi:hypothetical protein
MRRSISFAVAALAAPAWSAMQEKPSFGEADADGDGKVSFKEAKEHGFSIYQFAAQDVDQDGMLTQEDWRYLSRRSNFVLYDVQ